MKLLLASLVSLWSLAALGGLNLTQYFIGDGVAIHADGSAERYLISLSTKRMGEHKSMLSYDLQFGGKNVFFDLVYMHNKPDSSFFDVCLHDGVSCMTVGHGYCWGHKCHINWMHDGVTIEQTYERNRRSGAIHSTGSRRNDDGVIYLWKEKLNRLN